MEENESLVGHNLGNYHIIDEIARGGMATVYRATQASMKREVAIKVLPRSLTHDPTFMERFSREVQIISGLQHPHILPVYDSGAYQSMPYIVMAYLRGGTLADLIRKGPMELSEVYRIIEQVADALDYAHSQGIIHRDFKPGNVLLDDRGNTYLADFGLAKVSETSMQITGTSILGTPTYMAPEQAEPGPLTAGADVYAIGVTLFQMLTGRVPYEAQTPLGVLMAHATKPIPNVLEARPDLPEDIQYIIDKALAKSIEERYPTPGAVAAALGALLKTGTVETRESQAVGQEALDGLMMTNMLGQVIFIDGNGLKLLKRHHHEARTIIGKGLAEVLGVAAEEVQHFIQEVNKSGRVDQLPLQVKDAHGATINVHCTGVATYDDKKQLVGIDVTLHPVASAGQMLLIDFETMEEHLDSTEESAIETYFRSQMRTLRELLVQWGGRRVGENLEAIINETAQRNVWAVTMRGGDLSLHLRRTDVDVYRALSAKAIAYAYSVIGQKIVDRELEANDKRVDPRILAFVKELGIR